MAPDDTLWEAPPHTLAKHAILRAYLQAWFPILASRNQRIVYYDGFAGPGRYLGGEEGSPLIALSVARDHRAHLDAEIRFSFVEERQDRADHLRLELGRTANPAHFAVEVIDGTFEDSLRRVLDDLDRIGATIAPTFAFIDPFGIKGLPFQLIARLLRRNHCEVLITFMNVSIQRFVTELPGQVDSLIGTVDAATEIAASEDRVLRARELYMSSLRTVARFVRFFELRDQKIVPIYDLFFASNHPLGHYRMKEAMWKVDDSGAYSFSDGIDPRQAVLFGPNPGRDFAPELWQQFRGATIRSEKVLEHTRDETAGDGAPLGFHHRPEHPDLPGAADLSPRAFFRHHRESLAGELHGEVQSLFTARPGMGRRQDDTPRRLGEGLDEAVDARQRPGPFHLVRDVGDGGTEDPSKLRELRIEVRPQPVVERAG